MATVPSSIRSFLQQPYPLIEDQGALYRRNKFVTLNQVFGPELPDTEKTMASWMPIHATPHGMEPLEFNAGRRG